MKSISIVYRKPCGIRRMRLSALEKKLGIKATLTPDGGGMH